MKKIEVELDDSTYCGLKEMSELLEISIGALINNCWHDDRFHETHEDEIAEAQKVRVFYE